MEEQLPKMLDSVDILSYAVYIRGPAMVRPRGIFSTVRSPDAWEMLFSDHLLHVECKIWELSSYFLKQNFPVGTA